MRTVWVIGAIMTLLAGTAAPASASPSFDCAVASTQREKVICASPELSTLDQAQWKMARHKSAFLLGQGQAREREEYFKAFRAWREEGAEACGVAAIDNGPVPGHVTECLIARYRDWLAAAEEPFPLPSPPPITLHPEFQGTDLGTTFPQLKYTLKTHPKMDSVFETDGGDIIVRFMVLEKDANGIVASFTYWDVDVFAGTITKIGRDFTIPEGTHQLNPDGDFWGQYSVHGNGMDAYGHLSDNSYNGSLPTAKKCDSPLRSALVLHKTVNGSQVDLKRVFPIVKVSREGGIWMGGRGCEPAAPRQKVPDAATAIWNRRIPLRDGSFLAISNSLPTHIIRFDLNLNTEYRSPHLLILDEEQWGRLPTYKGVAEMQRILLPMFDSAVKE